MLYNLLAIPLTGVPDKSRNNEIEADEQFYKEIEADEQFYKEITKC